MVKSSVVLIPRYRVGMLPRYGEEGAGILAEEQHYLKPKQQSILGGTMCVTVEFSCAVTFREGPLGRKYEPEGLGYLAKLDFPL